MAAINYYLDNAADSGWQRLATAPVAAVTLNPGGWVVGTGATNHSAFEQGNERNSSTFVDTTPPDGTLDTALFDAFRSVDPLTGSFASANWVFHFVVRAITVGGAQDGRVRFRIIKADADGSNAVEITAGQQQASLVSNVSTSADFDSTLTVNPGAFTINNQHLFIQIAWERTGAGGMTTSDIAFRTGSSTTVGTRITTADFTQAVTGAHVASSSIGVGSVSVDVTGAHVAVSQLFSGAVVNVVVMKFLKRKIRRFIRRRRYRVGTDF